MMGPAGDYRKLASQSPWQCAVLKSTLAGRVFNLLHNSTLVAFLHIDVTISHQIAGVEQGEFTIGYHMGSYVSRFNTFSLTNASRTRH